MTLVIANKCKFAVYCLSGRIFIHLLGQKRFWKLVHYSGSISKTVCGMSDQNIVFTRCPRAHSKLIFLFSLNFVPIVNPNNKSEENKKTDHRRARWNVLWLEFDTKASSICGGFKIKVASKPKSMLNMEKQCSHLWLLVLKRGLSSPISIKMSDIHCSRKNTFGKSSTGCTAIFSFWWTMHTCQPDEKNTLLAPFSARPYFHVIKWKFIGILAQFELSQQWTLWTKIVVQLCQSNPVPFPGRVNVKQWKQDENWSLWDVL